MEDETIGQPPPKKEKPVFPGFNPSFKGYSQLPNDWLDEIVSQIDNVAELKIVLYIYRHTWGFQEKKVTPDDPTKHDEMKQITTDEFAHGRKRKDGTRMDNGTGLGLTAVKDGIARAIKHGYIVCKIDDSDRARIKKSYGLKMQKSDSRNPTTDSHNPTSKNRNPTTEETDSDHRSEKETPERNRMKERMKKSASPNVVSENGTSDSTGPSFHSSIHSSLSQKANVIAFIRMFMRKFLLKMGATGDLMDEHLKFLQEVYHASGLGKDMFRFEVEKAMDRTKEVDGDMEYFYDSLCRALHLERVS